MSILFYIIYIQLLLSYSYDIINILPYEHKFVQFNSIKTYNIFKYRHIILDNSKNSSFSIRSMEKNKIQDYQFFVYLEEKDINETNGNFINYDKYGSAKDYFIFSNCTNHEYYIVIKYNFYTEDTFYFFSTDSPYEIKDNFNQDYFLFENVNLQNYIFSISSKNDKYIKFGLTNYGNSGKSLTQIANKEENNVKLYEKESYNYVDYFELNENLIYYFNFSLFYKSASNSMYFLYIIKSNYSKITEVKKNN